MKNLLKSLMLLSFFALLASCNNDDEMDNETTVEQDQANLKQSMEDLEGCAEQVRDGRSLSEMMDNFFNVQDGYVLNEDWVDNMLDGLEDVVDFEYLEDNMRFDLAYHAGTHIFDNANGTWQKIADVTDGLVIKFPSSPDNTANNVEIIIDAYTDQLVTIDGESMSLPKTAHFLMNIDGTKAFEISLDNVTYADNSGFQLPVEIDATFFMDPMTIDINVTRPSTNSYDMALSFSNDQLCDVGLSTQFELEDDDFENLDEDSFTAAAVQVNLGQLSFRTMGDLAALLALDDPTDAQINSLADLDVFFNNMKIGDVEINENMETILVFYKDNTSEDLIDYLEAIGDILEDLLCL